MEKRRMMTLGLAVLRVMAVAALLWAVGNVRASPPMGPLAQGGAPLLLNYQGRLADPTTGLPKPDGTYNITFNIYDVETGGTPLWSETQVVTVTRGLFNVLLGSVTPLSASDFHGTSRWLELEVEGETLSPRVRMVSAPYAIQTEEAKNANLLDGQDSPYYLDWYNLTNVPAGFADGVDDNSGGDITAVLARTGLTGGGWSGVVTLALDTAYTDDYYWSLTGNAGTDPGGFWEQNFLGTTDNQALELRVNSARALRLEPNATSPNLIGGYSGNSVTAGVVGSTIGGGGTSSKPNRVTGDHGTVGGGLGNTASGFHGATVGGGLGNSASGWYYATVGGGSDNEASGAHATVPGGHNNESSGNSATVGGGEGNTASNWYATVGGGYINIASGDGATVGGGGGNTASAWRATVGGGLYNTASGQYATIGGGHSNQATADYTTIAGGGRSDPNDAATANRVTDNYGTVGGGGNNQAGNANGNLTDAVYNTVGGGEDNVASGGSCIPFECWGHATVGGGRSNAATFGYATVGGGESNTASAEHATVGGGYDNEAGGPAATVSGGSENNASGNSSTVSGGAGNTASATDATVGGGYGNEASGGAATVGGGWENRALGEFATVVGGYDSTARGDYSFAAGGGADAYHDGAFVWADSTLSGCASQRPNQFRVLAHGGARFDAGARWVELNWDPIINTSTGAYLSNGGIWTNASDRNAKENFRPIDGQEILRRLAKVLVTTWNYKAEDPSVRHIGPTGQDFYAAFGVGEDDTHISTVDADGVALAAIQGLYQLSQEQAAHIEELEAEKATLQQRLDGLEARVVALEQTLNTGRASASSNSLPTLWALFAGLPLLGLVLGWRKHRGGGR